MIAPFLVASVSVLLFGVNARSEPHRDFQRAAAEPDPSRRAEAVRPFLDSADGSCYVQVLEVWAGCGKAALPVLRTLSADETRTDRSCLVDTLVRAGGKDAVADLERLLEVERTYWDNLGLNLDEESKIPHARFQLLVDILGHLGELGYRDGNVLVRAIHDRFDDHPILRDYGKQRAGASRAGPSQVVEAAQVILLRK